ncbi:alpha-hydroxy acid oxidase [Paracoccus albus]|uniref:alpha-hydroxy acid oxidase n=1 Tax=Paracoccus albus TaxID=3017784 RepID=UPI0022F1392D|nr:alpha-hydroxy acid oxidase [Paracoccus albus]WBU62020.1 alpha-hydroxy acid oxidase [Paracoccus albus]
MSDPVSISRRKPVTVPRRLQRFLALDDFEPAARRLLPRAIFGYVSGGVENNASLNANRNAFNSMGFRPRILQDVSERDQTTRLFDEDIASPFAIAPMGFSAVAAFDGDVALAKGAAEAGIFAICSAASLTPLERVAKEGGSRWFQAYIPGDDNRIRPLLERLKHAGFDRLVVTGDVPVASNRENNARNGFDAPFRMSARLAWQGFTHPRWSIGTLGKEIVKRGMPHFENMEAVQGPPLFSRDLVRSTIARDKLSWDHIRRIRDLWSGKLIVKGVMHPGDAVAASDAGCDAIIVSNHGGRQLDGTVSPLRVLPQIREAVPEMVVIVDGGIRRGTDVLKAIMLGADFTLVGRPFLYAAATHGIPGVAHAAKLLREEIDRDMALLGVTSPFALRGEQSVQLD